MVVSFVDLKVFFIQYYVHILAIPSQKLKFGKMFSKEKESARSDRRMAVKRHNAIIKDVLEAHLQECKEISRVNIDLFDVPSTSKESDEDILKRKYDELVVENLKLKEKLEENEGELFNAKMKITELSKINKDKDIDIEKNILDLFQHIFTKNELEIILKKKQRACWSTEEISKAFTIRYFSKRCYIYLRNTLKYPLPGISTLQKWATHINLKSGLLKDVLRVMFTAGKSNTELQRVTVLSYDEMKVCSVYEFDQKEDEVVGPYKYMQVVMARGLFDRWKQPVYICFDTSMTQNILSEIITELHKINYDVVACVCDCGGGNQGIWKKMNISIERTYFPHPVTEKNIYICLPMLPIF